jgi:hypothetical protein
MGDRKLMFLYILKVHPEKMMVACIVVISSCHQTLYGITESGGLKIDFMLHNVVGLIISHIRR